MENRSLFGREPRRKRTGVSATSASELLATSIGGDTNQTIKAVRSGAGKLYAAVAGFRAAADFKVSDLNTEKRSVFVARAAGKTRTALVCAIYRAANSRIASDRPRATPKRIA